MMRQFLFRGGKGVFIGLEFLLVEFILLDSRRWFEFSKFASFGLVGNNVVAVVILVDSVEN